MAVTFKTEANYGYKLMELFGVTPSLIMSAKKAGVLVDQTYPGSFHVMHNGINYGAVVIKGQAISLVKSGSLGPSSKQAVSVQFEQALKKALSSAGVELEVFVPIMGSVPAASATKSPAPKISIDEAVGTVQKDKPFTEADVVKPGLVKKSPPSAASSSFYLKQKIAGTSNGSTYTVFALIAGGLVLAGRVKNGILSIRAVFADPKAGKMKFTSVLKGLGFSSKTSGPASYMSAHYSCGSKELMTKTVGAIIGTLGFENVDGISNMSEVLE